MKFDAVAVHSFQIIGVGALLTTPSIHAGGHCSFGGFAGLEEAEEELPA